MKWVIAATKKRGVAIVATLRRALPWLKGWPRPAQLVGVVAAVGAVVLSIDAAHGWQVWDQLFHPRRSRPADVSFWSALVYNLVLLTGLPVAFLIWHWRDRNARDQIENARKDTNLKEFQEVQGRAAGLFDEKMPQSAREQLQIAALHQLRGFLRGEYGDAFRRPAFELILAGHAEAMDRIGMREVQRQIEEAKLKPDRVAMEKIEDAMRAKLDRIMRERIGIIRDEADAILRCGFPLRGRILDFCDFRNQEFPKALDLSRASLLFATLSAAHLQEISLLLAHLEGAHLLGANLESANLCGAHLEGASLVSANLTGTDLFVTQLHHADMEGARFDDQTRFGPSYIELSDSVIKAGQNRLRELGARHIDDPNWDELPS